MTPNTVYNPTLRHMKGSARWLFKEVNGDGSDLDTPDTWHVGPAIKESSLKDDTAEEAYEIESGDEFSQDGKRSSEWSGMFAQNDTATQELMTKTLRGKYVAIVKEESVAPIGGVIPMLFIPAARAIPSTDRKLPGGEIPFKFKPSALSSSLSQDLTAITGTTNFKGTFTGTIAMAAGDHYKDFTLTPA